MPFLELTPTRIPPILTLPNSPNTPASEKNGLGSRPVRSGAPSPEPQPVTSTSSFLELTGPAEEVGTEMPGTYPEDGVDVPDSEDVGSLV